MIKCQLYAFAVICPRPLHAPSKKARSPLPRGRAPPQPLPPYALLPCKVYVSMYVDLGPMQAELDSVWRYLSSGPFKEMKIGTRVSLAYLAHPKQLLLEVTAAVGHHGGEALCCPVFQLSISRYRLGSPHGHGPGQARFRISLHTSKALTLEARARAHTHKHIYICMYAYDFTKELGKWRFLCKRHRFPRTRVRQRSETKRRTKSFFCCLSIDHPVAAWVAKVKLREGQFFPHDTDGQSVILSLCAATTREV